MLVITRKEGEAILIGENIEICILNVADRSIKIGINAPKNIKILRKELISEVKDQNVEAVQNSDISLENLLKVKLEKKG
jgi:carbon storage regulator